MLNATPPGSANLGTQALAAAVKQAVSEFNNPALATLNSARFNTTLDNILKAIQGKGISNSGGKPDLGFDRDTGEDSAKSFLGGFKGAFKGMIPSKEELGGKLGDSVKGAMVAPIAVMTGVIAGAFRNNKGAQAFGGALEVLTTTVGTALTPLFVVLGAAALAVSDYLWEKLLPNLEKWTALVIKYAEKGADIAEDAADTGNKLLEGDFSAVWNKIKGDFGVDQSLAPTRIGADPFAESPGAGNYSEVDKAPKASRFQSALKDMLIEMRRATGGQASFGGLADAAKQAQLAAFGSPFERRMQEMTAKMLQAMEKTAVNTEAANKSFGGDF